MARWPSTNPSSERSKPGSSKIASDVPLPPLSDQEAITEILGALDAKIESNRRMNETLESLARAIFKSWFVDFDPVRAKMDGHPPPGLSTAVAALFPRPSGASYQRCSSGRTSVAKRRRLDSASS